MPKRMAASSRCYVGAGVGVLGTGELNRGLIIGYA